MDQQKKVVRNPYARKKQPPSDGAVMTTASSIASPPQARFAAATFSQAFGHDDNHPSRTTAARGQSRFQGDAVPAATGPQESLDATLHPNLTDRESHVLIQPHVLYVSHKQKGNAVLNYVRNVPTAFSRMVPDYIMSAKRCALFLSCKYHALYPQYIHRRIAELGHDFELRVLLVLVDVEDNANTLRQLNKLAVVNELTLILAWSEEEAARYLETFKAFDGKDATLIQKREQTHFVDQVADFLTACKTVNKTDSATLLSQFGSIHKLTQAGPDDLALVSGMGQVKVKRLYEAFHKPFSKKASKRRKQQQEQQQEKLDFDIKAAPNTSTESREVPVMKDNFGL